MTGHEHFSWYYQNGLMLIRFNVVLTSTIKTRFVRVVRKLRPGIIMLEVETNDLSFLPLKVVISDLEKLIVTFKTVHSTKTVYAT